MKENSLTKNNLKNTDIIGCNFKTLANNLKNHTNKYGYNLYYLSKDNLLISNKNLTIKEINQEKCKLLGEEFHYYW